MKRLLIFHSALAPYRVDFFNAIAEHYVCHIAFLSRNNRNQPFCQEELLRDAKFSYSYLDKKVVLKDRDLNIGYIQEIKRFKPDIIIGGEYGLPLIVPYLFRRISKKKYTLYTICDDSLHIARQCKGLRKWFRDFLVPRIDNIILTTTPIADWYKTYFHLSHAPVVFPIIQDEKKYRSMAEKLLPIAHRYRDMFQLKGKKIFLFVGRLTEVKNLPYLINEYAHVANDKNHLIIVGEGELKNDLKELARERGIADHVSIVGRYEGDGLYAWYHCANILVLPSISEPFGAVIPEALMSGCKVICSKNAGASGLIDGANGRVVDVSTSNALASAIAEMEKEVTPIEEMSLRPSQMSKSFEGYLKNFTEQVI